MFYGFWMTVYPPFGYVYLFSSLPVPYQCITVEQNWLRYHGKLFTAGQRNFFTTSVTVLYELPVRSLIAALPEKPKLLEIIRNDLCSYSGLDIPRVSYFHPQNFSDPASFITLYRCLSGQLSRFFIFHVVSEFWSYQKFALKRYAACQAQRSKH